MRQNREKYEVKEFQLKKNMGKTPLGEKKAMAWPLTWPEPCGLPQLLGLVWMQRRSTMVQSRKKGKQINYEGKIWTPYKCMIAFLWGLFFSFRVNLFPLFFYSGPVIAFCSPKSSNT